MIQGARTTIRLPRAFADALLPAGVTLVLRGSDRISIPPHPRRDPPKWIDTSFRSLFDAAPDAMLVANRAGEIVVANTQAEGLFGYSREKLIGRLIESLIPPRLRDHDARHRENCFGDPRVRPMGVGLELFALRGDGAEIPIEISVSPITTGSGTFVISAIRDAIEFRRVEGLKQSEVVLRKIRESEQRFQLVADTAPVMIWMSVPTSSAPTSINHGSISLDCLWIRKGETDGRRGFIRVIFGSPWILTHKLLVGEKSSGWSIASDGATENVD